MRSSLSRNFLLGLGAASLAFTVLATLCAFAVFQHELVDRQISFLSEYVQERTENVGREFTALRTVHRSAVRELERRTDAMTPQQADIILDKVFPLRADGTRRTRPEDFDGRINDAGVLVYGMGGYIGDAAHLPADEKVAIASAYALVASFGRAVHGSYDNFYFYTPHNRMIMFGPDRPDGTIPPARRAAPPCST
jgi:hypothetical protein